MAAVNLVPPAVLEGTYVCSVTISLAMEGNHGSLAMEGNHGSL